MPEGWQKRPHSNRPQRCFAKPIRLKQNVSWQLIWPILLTSYPFLPTCPCRSEPGAVHRGFTTMDSSPFCRPSSHRKTIPGLVLFHVCESASRTGMAKERGPSLSSNSNIQPILTPEAATRAHVTAKRVGKMVLPCLCLVLIRIFDYDAIVKSARARLSMADHERVLLLTKATGAVPHGGGSDCKGRRRLRTILNGCERGRVALKREILF